jgi:hypothetical protein
LSAITTKFNPVEMFCKFLATNKILSNNL